MQIFSIFEVRSFAEEFASASRLFSESIWDCRELIRARASANSGDTTGAEVELEVGLAEGVGVALGFGAGALSMNFRVTGDSYPNT